MVPSSSVSSKSRIELEKEVTKAQTDYENSVAEETACQNAVDVAKNAYSIPDEIETYTRYFTFKFING